MCGARPDLIGFLMISHCHMYTHVQLLPAYCQHAPLCTARGDHNMCEMRTNNNDTDIMTCSDVFQSHSNSASHYATFRLLTGRAVE